MPQRLYIDVHILQTVPPANLNRDDNGNPKEAYFGGVRRSRVSSQAWKRATRKLFTEELPEEQLGTRTKRIASELAKRLVAQTPGLGNEQADRLAVSLLKPLGIKAGRKAEETAYLLFYGHRQLNDIAGLVAGRAGELAALDDKALAAELDALPVREQLRQHHPIDVALFGRMVADIPALNVDAATQVAHALSTHAVELESDYYTAVDDKNEKDETGAGMIGTVGFNSATLYRYATVGVHQLAANLAEPERVVTAARLFVDAFARSMPTGHGNTFAHRTRPSLVAVVVRDDQPVNLVSAFERPVSSAVGSGIAAGSARRLAREFQTAVEQWGDEPGHVGVCHMFTGQGGGTGGVGGSVGDVDEHDGVRDDLAKAFGENRTFPALLDGLTEHLGAVWKQG
ncbi:type I-E CRISPR-associated protein Cas7/Cse4/CasC [Streptomyces sp. URMC 129]|uniref:type I-E CRISPR-associated protein Cas7/Cse4/CasC n=1 Tax=Streptomyces sp. URMC 129 TaxID=3423407 RepID=UPI003F1AE13A